MSNKVQAARAALSSKMREVEAMRDRLAAQIKEQDQAVEDRAREYTVTYAKECADTLHAARRDRARYEGLLADIGRERDYFRTISQNATGLCEILERRLRSLTITCIGLGSSVVLLGSALAYTLGL